MADDIENSSDIEFSDQEPKSSRVGQRAIASIIKKSAVDRIESKKKTKQLTDVANAPGTDRHRTYWFKLFNTFAQHTLQIDHRPNTTPTGEDIVRFLAQLPSHLQSHHDDGKISWTVIKQAAHLVERALTFHHEDFNLSKRGSMRIDAIVQQLLNDGHLTKDPIREALWLSSQMVKRMAMAVFSDAMLNGTKSWDATLSGLLALVMQAALASRAGDIKRSGGYKGVEYLKWEDIVLVAKGSSVTDPKLTMLMTLKYRKNYKNDPGNALKLEFGQLEEENNAIDIIKLLVAYGLRVESVAEKTWTDSIATVLRRPSKRYVWSNPKQPVFFALTSGERLDFSKPAGAHQQTRFLRYASGLIGMMAQPVSHDLRRGAAAEMALLGPMTNMENARVTLGHSREAAHRGTTDKYIGRLKGDTWSARINNSVNVPEDPFDVQLAPTKFVLRKIATKDIDNYCTSNDLDLEDRQSRYKARTALEKVQYDQWLAHQQLMMNTPSAPSRTAEVLSSGNVSHTPARIDPASLDQALMRGPLADITNLPRLPPATRVQDDASDASEDIEEPSVRAMIGVLGLHDDNHSSKPSADAVDSMSLAYVSMLASVRPSEQSSILTSPISDFVGFLSTINLVSTATPNLPYDAETGGSRDVPSKFMHVCRKKDCPRTFDSPLRRDQHEVNCKGASFANLNDEASLSIGKDQQQMVGTGRKRKRVDLSVVHDGFPKPCPDSDICGVTKDFATKHLLTNHRNLHHDDTWPKETACNVTGCQLPQDHYFVSRQMFQRHLSDYHLFDNAEAVEHIGKIITVTFRAPRGTSASFMTTMCLFPNCKTTAEFASYADYTDHLKRAHKRTSEQYPQYMPTATTVRLHPRPDMSTLDISSPVAREFQAGLCNHPLCSDIDTTYTAQRDLIYHLNVSHGVEKCDASKFFRGSEIAPFYGTRCLHADCRAKPKFFSTKESYKGHLKNIHDLSTIAEISSVQLWYKLKYDTAGMANERQELTE